MYYLYSGFLPIKFQIQILTSAKSLKTSDAVFKGINNIEEYTHNGVYKYLSGTTDKYEEAKLIHNKIYLCTVNKWIPFFKGMTIVPSSTMFFIAFRIKA